MEMVPEVYRLTRGFPREELYGLASQLRRAAVSIASNIAEGKGRSSDKELLYFLSNAKGSLFEVETQIMIADRLGYLSHLQAEELLSKKGRNREASKWFDKGISQYSGCVKTRSKLEAWGLKPEA